jgi:chromate reductase
MRVLGIAGSLRRDSHNRRLLRAAADLLPSGVELVEFDGLKAIPPFDEDDEHAPGEAVEAFRAALAQADVVLFATPEYNGSVPGVLKNAIDWASRKGPGPVPAGPDATAATGPGPAAAALRNKPVAVIGASPGMFGAVWAQAELRKVLSTAGARVVDRELPVAAADEAFTDDGRLVEADHHNELAAIVEQLVAEGQLRVAHAA